MTGSAHIAIAGGGIGGLCAALALARAGQRVTVLEREPHAREAGAGLQLAPNATRALRDLGLLDALRDAISTPDALCLRRAEDGRIIVRLPLGSAAEARWGAPYGVIHRADLHRILAEHCAAHPAIQVIHDAPVVGFGETPQEVVALVQREGNVERIAADGLVGADGLRSSVRAQLMRGKADAPVWSGRTAWRALLPAQAAPAFARANQTGLWLGARAHLVHYPIRLGTLVNIIAITDDGARADDAGDLWTLRGARGDIAPRFARWHGEARALIDSARDWRRWPLFDRPAKQGWGSGRVTLLGDAAHPMLPFLAQGAAQAIEDAAALGQAFARQAADVPAALAEYQRASAGRAAAVVQASRTQGTIYHLSGLPARARDLVMAGLGPRGLQSRLDWLYGAPPKA